MTMKAEINGTPVGPSTLFTYEDMDRFGLEVRITVGMSGWTIHRGGVLVADLRGAVMTNPADAEAIQAMLTEPMPLVRFTVSGFVNVVDGEHLLSPFLIKEADREAVLNRIGPVLDALNGLPVTEAGKKQAAFLLIPILGRMVREGLLVRKPTADDVAHMPHPTAARSELARFKPSGQVADEDIVRFAIQGCRPDADAALFRIAEKARTHDVAVADNAAMRSEVVAVIESMPNAVRVREGNGEENVFASLAVSVAALLERHRKELAQARNEGVAAVESVAHDLAHEAERYDPAEYGAVAAAYRKIEGVCRVMRSADGAAIAAERDAAVNDRDPRRQCVEERQQAAQQQMADKHAITSERDAALLERHAGGIVLKPDGTVELPPEAEWPAFFIRTVQWKEGLFGYHRSGSVILLRPNGGTQVPG